MMRKLFESTWTPRYLLALGITAALLIFVNLTIHYITETQKDRSALVNTSGKQRMLTKEIAIQSIQLVNSKSPAERERFRLGILAAANQMQNAQDRLLSSASPALHTMYLEPPTLLNYQVLKYIEEARNLAYMADTELSERHNPHLDYIVAAASGELLIALDEAAGLFQRESEAKILQLQRIEIGSLVMVLFVLMMEGLYIFRPMIRTIEQEKIKLLAVNNELERLSFVDGLTGVANRRYFDEFSRREWDRAVRERTPFSLVMIDIDYFKAYNDIYGHQAGDTCLQQVAGKLRELIKRPSDLVARYGGEEFIVVLPNTDLTGATSLAENFRASVESLHINHSGSSISEFVTISLGIAAANPERAFTLNALIGLADNALYKAKQSGRNKVVALAINNDSSDYPAAATQAP